jgi:hypothetical protein
LIRLYKKYDIERAKTLMQNAGPRNKQEKQSIKKPRKKEA